MSKPSDACVTAFERHYDTDWNDSSMRNERLSWIGCWKAATACQGCAVTQGTHKPAQAVHQIAEPAHGVEKQAEEVNSLIGWLKSYARQPQQAGLPDVKLHDSAEMLKKQKARITSLEALLKFADARINLLAGQAEGAQSSGQAPVVVPNTTPADEANRIHGDAYGVDWVYPAPALEVSALKPLGYAAEINGSRLLRFDDWLPDSDCYDQGTLVELYALPVSEEEAEKRRVAASQPNGEAQPAFYFDMDDDDEDGAPGFKTVKECIEYTAERRELKAGAVVSVGVFHKEDGEDKEPDFHCSVEIISNDPELENQPVWVAKPNGEV